MNIIVDILTLIVKLLILIGDITIFIIRFTSLLVKNFFKLALTIVNDLNTQRQKIKAKIGIFLKKALSKKVKKRRIIKATKIFPLPISQKAKYFAFGSAFSLLFVFLPLLFVIFLEELPHPKQLSFREAPLTTKIFDRNGTLLYQIYTTHNRTLVPLESIPKYLQSATIAAEDKNFYGNFGFDISAIIRAAIADLSGKPLQGASTITQQLIKSTLLTSEISLKRKIKEIILAFWAERIYTKDQILEMYFNRIPYGGTAWGVEAASEVYFGKEIKDLNLAQSAFLAGLTRAPTLYSPYGQSSNLWKKRQVEVLTKMNQLGYINSKQKNDAIKEKLTFSNREVPIHAPHFVMYVKDLLISKYGLGMVEKGGLRVITSLDLKTQETVQKILTTEVQNNEYLNLTNGASIVTNPKNGDILAMVGSRDYKEPELGNFNVTTALRQPGSSIKVVTYAAALDRGFTAATILDDSPITFRSPGSPPYSPVNYDGKFHGLVTLRQALGNSINIPAIKVLSKIGIPTMVNLGQKMGITTWQDPSKYGLAITLGGAEVKMTDMATVYGVLANGGYRVDLNPILSLSDSQGNTLEEKKDIKGVEVVDPGIAFIISNILADNKAREMEFGSNSPLYIPNYNVSVKTGTSDNKRDNWTIGYAPEVVAAVWVGNNDNSPMSQYLASGITGAAPIWNNIMLNLLSTKNNTKTNMPSNIVKKNCLGKDEYFIKGTENLINCKYIPKQNRILTSN